MTRVFLMWGFICGVAAAFSLTDQAMTAPTRQDAVKPGPRTAACLIYDEQRRQSVLLGGYLWSSPRNQLEMTELWAWGGKRWERISGSGLMARTLTAAVYDTRRKRLVSFWGVGANKEQRWEWDGKSWRQLAEIRADSRIHPAMVYDAGRGKIVMYGGTILRQANSGAPQRWELPTDTWEENDLQWKQVATQGPVGRAIACGSMVYDSQRKQVVLFGGIGESPGAGQPQPVYNDTWVWNGKNWRQVSSSGPQPRMAHSLAFDRRAGVVLLYGGSDLTGQFGDMWQWDGKRWTEIRLTGATPGRRSNHAMAYDAARDRTVLYGGADGQKTLEDTWEWDGKQWAHLRYD